MHEQSGSDTNIKYYGKNCSNEKLTKAVEIILEEMKKKDEIIKELKYQNELLQKKIEELTTEDFILEGVDFHCFPSILDDIIKESRVNYTKQELKDTIWEYNSKINFRKDNTVLEKKLEIIWSDIKCVLRKLQLTILEDMVLLIKSNK